MTVAGRGRTGAILLGIAVSTTAWADGPAVPGAGSGLSPVPAAPGSPTPDTSAGRQTPGPGNVPAILPPAGEVTDPDDQAFLRQTAGTLGVKDANDRIDSRILNWFGVRSKLADHGLTFDFSVTADYSKNLMGGLNTRTDAFRHLFDARITLDTQPLFNLQGGTFSIDFQNQNRRNGSDILTGDAQGFDNADADGRTQISELWYEQKLLDEKLRIKIGKVDANSEFAAPEYGSEFVNSSFGYSPTITSLPTYPDTALSANIYIYPTPWLYAGYGIYDGDAQGDHPPTSAFRSPTDYFQIAEIGVRWVFADQTLPGRLAGGVFYNNATFEKFDGSTQSGTSGFYVVAEQKLIHCNFYAKDDARGLYAFTQYGWGDEEVNDLSQHVGAGLSWVGPYPAENFDSLGIGFTTVFFTDAAGSPYTQDSETSVEAYYNFQATSYLSIKPDLQYIIHPGGDDTIDDALVATLRVTIAF